jgi:hypothetical protein
MPSFLLALGLVAVAAIVIAVAFSAVAENVRNIRRSQIGFEDARKRDSVVNRLARMWRLTLRVRRAAGVVGSRRRRSVTQGGNG